MTPGLRADRSFWVTVGGALVAALVGSGCLVGLGIWLVYFPPMLESHRSVDTDDRIVALTYDDGPNPPHTDRLLRVLESHSARATFFMMGRHAELHPETVRRVIAAGHQIGNHSYSDATLTFRSPGFVREQIHRTDEILQSLGAPAELDFRAPHVAPFLPVAWVLSREGRRHIGANVVPQDWSTDDADAIAEHVLARVGPGSIVLFHDGLDVLDGADRSATVEATERVVSALSDRGYRFLTVRELLAHRQ